MNRFSILLGAALTFPTVSVAADNYSARCTRGDDARTIAVVSPGLVGKRCDVRYTQTGDARVPFHADNSSDFCEQKARELVGELATSGFDCAEFAALPAATSPPVTAAAEASQPESDFVVDVERVAPAQTLTSPSPQPAAPEPVVDAVEDVAPAIPETTVSELRLEESAVAQTAAIASVPAAAEDVLREPARVADGAPARLFDETAPVEQSNIVVANARRITGATPDVAPRAVEQGQPPRAGATPVLQTSAVQAPAPTTSTPVAASTASAASAPVAGESKPKVATNALRSPEEIIVATLEARIAAWNEGNLNAFMETYWKDKKLKFVSGSSVNSGWTATMRQYRDDHASPEGLGSLSFENMDVNLITDDVAVVTGRFNLVKSEQAENGTYSLVLRRFDGAWRIVHDHTNPDIAVPTE